ncbi:Murein DD-endopeptidase MepM and murein hydrolase activator NlpD, contain LysM domain [Micromonospora nigra]|uniref:Murein DD-endopeptidase MepM and murein hydrolase activator NlpD, contain LysM domain n=1 Tax=Micromonospora nigra TaxID=145857 RepID=A0A1C6RQQ7_9ACTN|nr:M23 family metallopeptidase [Micromonospora nigra]SCL19463.1 Murein DD-endopeptidase MepM and murein hydrolase activator NlpD, contain LysM domain [Micromonospora nigra]
MQEHSTIRSSATPDAPARHRRRASGRTRALVVGAVAVVGLGLGGVAVATTAGDGPGPAPAALDAQSRAEAADRVDRSDRADRSDRRTATPSATPTSPTPSPSASRRPAAATPEATKTTKTARPTPKKTSKPAATWVIPMKGAAITSCYGPRWGTLHAGVDFALPAGTPVRAAFGGTVTKAGDVGDGYGISVVVDHHNGYLTHYAHLSTTRVGVGDKVTAGQTIGLEGSTGDSTGPHLHFEVHQGQMWNQIDPAPFLRARGVDVAC